MSEKQVKGDPRIGLIPRPYTVIPNPYTVSFPDHVYKHVVSVPGLNSIQSQHRSSGMASRVRVLFRAPQP